MINLINKITYLLAFLFVSNLGFAQTMRMDTYCNPLNVDYTYMITTQYKHKGQTNEIQGISFSKGGISFKGSEVDRRFSYSKLVQQITQNGKQAQQLDTRNMESKSIGESVLDGLSGTGLLQTYGDDYEEEAFRNRIEYEESKRQRKKKKRKGFGL